MIKFQKIKPEHIYTIRSKNELPLGRRKGMVTGMGHGKGISEMWVLFYLLLGGCYTVVFTETLNLTLMIDALYCRHVTLKLKSLLKEKNPLCIDW